MRRMVITFLLAAAVGGAVVYTFKTADSNHTQEVTQNVIAMASEPVQVRLGVDPKGNINRALPMLVWGEDQEHRRAVAYNPVLTVLNQIAESEAGGRFLGEWDGTHWQIDKRIPD